MYRKPKNEKDALYILDHLREPDRCEAMATRGKNWKEEILKDYMETDRTWLGARKKDGLPVCMGGEAVLTKDAPDEAAIWMLSTDEIIKHRVSLLKEAAYEIKQCDKEFRLLYNFIYYKNTFAKNWLSKLGFKFDKPRLMNAPEGFEFFYRIRPEE